MPLCIMLPKIREKTRSFDETKYIYFFIKDDELLQKYNKIWDTLSNIIKKDLIVNQYAMKIPQN